MDDKLKYVDYCRTEPEKASRELVECRSMLDGLEEERRSNKIHISVLKEMLREEWAKNAQR